MMFKTFEKRRSERLASSRNKPRPMSFQELLALDLSPSSEDRLLALPEGSWSPEAFREAAREFVRETGVRIKVFERTDAIPPLGPDVQYKYASYSDVAERISDGEDLLVAVVMEGERGIGYGIARRSDAGCEIEIIDVDQFSRRETGLQREIAVGGTTFGVGVGHVVVNELIEALRASTEPRVPITVDATSHSSRYIFRSLGFLGHPDDCDLQLPI